MGEALPEPGMIALYAALISIVSKEILYQYTVIAAKRTGSDALRANAWHHRSDAFSSVGTTLGIGGAIFRSAMALARPIGRYDCECVHYQNGHRPWDAQHQGIARSGITRRKYPRNRADHW